jgi:hypothetical protein
VALNTQVAFTDADKFSVDTQNPTVVSVTSNRTSIDDSHVGATLTITITFSEAMNTAILPGISLSPTVSGLTSLSFSWDATNSIFTINYTISDANETRFNVTAFITNARDVGGNLMVTYVTPYALFSVDTENPQVLSVAVSDTFINDADIPGIFRVTVTFNEPMSTGVFPSITFTPSVSGLTFLDRAWDATGRVLTVRYTITDANETKLDIDIGISGARDSAGNLQVAYVASDVFSVDTLTIPPVVVTYNLTLYAGRWNMVSVPIVPTNPAPYAVFGPHLGVIFTYDAEAGRYVIPTAIRPGVGYLVWFNTTATITITGSSVPADFAISLKSGWNMIGSHLTANVSWAKLRIRRAGVNYTIDEAYSRGWIENRFHFYDGVRYVNEYGDEDGFNTGRGYWIRASEDLSLIILP